MHKIIALLNKGDIARMNDVEAELKVNGCDIQSKWNWGGIAFDSILSIKELEELNIAGVEEYSENKEITIADPDSPIQ